jgi:hypothetical protein
MINNGIRLVHMNTEKKYTNYKIKMQNDNEYYSLFY